MHELCFNFIFIFFRNFMAIQFIHNFCELQIWQSCQLNVCQLIVVSLMNEKNLRHFYKDHIHSSPDPKRPGLCEELQFTTAEIHNRNVRLCHVCELNSLDQLRTSGLEFILKRALFIRLRTYDGIEIPPQFERTRRRIRLGINSLEAVSLVLALRPSFFPLEAALCIFSALRQSERILVAKVLGLTRIEKI